MNTEILGTLITTEGRDEILDVAAIAERETGRKVETVFDWGPLTGGSWFRSVAGAKRSLNAMGLDRLDKFVVIMDLGESVHVEIAVLEPVVEWRNFV